MPDDNAKAKSESEFASLRIVGVGASAGGLEALRDLMEVLPVSDTLCYVIAQHVSPTHVSMLMSLLSPMTELRVEDLSDKQKPMPRTVYITPPNKDVVIEKGLLRLTEPTANIGPKPSVNRFFESLAEAMPDQCVGIILSGTGTDGATGVRAIKAAGGITFAQEPSTAKYDGMPKAAIHTGSVDLILSPAQMGDSLHRLLDAPNEIPLVMEEGEDGNEITEISNLVRMNACFKLSDYKLATVRRRIMRRMSIVGVANYRQYIDYLRENKEESYLLMKDTFIGVTSFFRDPSAFQSLQMALEDLVNKAEPGKVIRCWIPGCSSGEEAYTIAMLLEDTLNRLEKTNQQYMIFASDLDDDALDRARASIYPCSDMNNIPRGFRERFTEKIGDHFRIIKAIRSRIVFTRQNVIEDPPFGRLDLISCRNLLIYLTAPVQKRVLEIFHYALNQKGYLFLGKSESVEQQSSMFTSVERRERLYRREDGIGHYNMPVARILSGQVSVDKPSNRPDLTTSTDVVSMRVLEELVQRYAPASLVVDSDDYITHFQGDLTAFLRFPKGRAEMYVFDLVDSVLRVDLRALIYSCRRELKTTKGSVKKIETPTGTLAVLPVVSPLDPASKSHLLVSFIVQPELEASKPGEVTADERESVIVSELEQELSNTRAHLNVVVEELETSNEELQSLNEELQSTNEELQSTNEELQTSNEELQSTNEELLTVNEELQVKSAEVELTASDLNNVKNSLTYPLIVVDKTLRITQVNKACSAIVQQEEYLESASFYSIQWKLAVPGLAEEVRRVAQGGDPYRAIINGEDDDVFSLEVMSYRQENGEIDGAVLLFENITLRHRAECALQESEKKLRLMVNNVREYAIFFLDATGKITSWNSGAQAVTGYKQSDVLGGSFSLLFSVSDRNDGLPEQLLSQAQKNGNANDEYGLVNRHGDTFLADTTLAAIHQDDGDLIGFTLLIRDITSRRQAQDALRASEARFRQVTESLPQLVWTCNADGECDYLSPQWVRYTGIPEEQQLGHGWINQVHPDDQQLAKENWMLTISSGSRFAMEFRIRRYDGSYRCFRTLALPLRNEHGAIVKWFGSNTDIEDIKQVQTELQASRDRVAHIIDVIPDAVLVIDTDGTIDTANQQATKILGYSPEELLGSVVEKLIPEQYRSGHVQLRKDYGVELLARRMAESRNIYALHKAGHEIPVEISMAPLQADGVSRVVVSISDITNRKKSEEEIRLAANVFSNTLDGIVILSPEKTIIKVNPAFERIIGYRSEQVVGQHISLLYSDRHDTEFYEQLWNTVTERGGWQGEVWDRHNNGRVIPIWMGITSLQSENGGVGRYIVTLYDITEQKMTQERINYLAHYDVLTELPNRTLFMDRFDHALEQAQRNQKSAALFFIDLDNFKQVNDTHGHPVGDELLCKIAERLKVSTRTSDTVGRLSGDEFLVLIENYSSQRNIRQTAQKILSALSDPIDLNGNDFYISASMGIACYPDDGSDVNTLLKNADLAMYRAKDTGRNKFHFYNQAMSDYIKERMELLADLRKAVADEQLELYFQPVVTLEGAHLVGAEALTRWQHPEQGWVSPAKFIPLAEEEALIHPLGEWVLRTACSSLKSWMDQGLDIDFLSVNVSGKQVMQSDFLPIAATILAETQCPAERITLELTESFIMNESDLAIERLRQLRALGFGIAIDDFGTGYSSLSYLKRLPVTKLKLDQSFVRDIPNDLNDVAIARAILKLGEAVGLEVVAEGVETQEQNGFLLEEGCKLCQGYLYAKPEPEAAFVERLANAKRSA